MLAAAILLLVVLPLRRFTVTPVTEAVFTSTRYITCLVLAPNGDLWAGTTGGLLQRTPDGQWRKFTRKEGLPSQEIRGLTADAQGVVAALPTGAVRLEGGSWKEIQQETAFADSPNLPNATAKAIWRGNRYAANAAGMYVLAGSEWKQIALPPSSGTHISALLPRGSELWAAMFGDGVWAYDGATWKPVELNLPEPAKEITALAGSREALWIGTRRAGVWELRLGAPSPQTPNGARSQGVPAGSTPSPHHPEGTRLSLNSLTPRGTRLGGRGRAVIHGSDVLMANGLSGGYWRQHLQPGEPLDHNCQALAMYRGSLFASTLEEGLVVRGPRGWGHVGAPQISSNAPRQMVVFRDCLYLRHGSGKLDRWDGARWERNIGALLPRRQVSALAEDGERLYAAQWGGWSEYDGKAWTHHLDLPELQGLPVTALCPRGDRLWLGTQSRGVAEIDRRNSRLVWYDERHGLPDDWITALAPDGPTIVAGTFIGGLAQSNISPQGAVSHKEFAARTFTDTSWNDNARYAAMRLGKLTSELPAASGGRREDTPWITRPELAGQNVTALEPDGAGGLFVATRNGVWHSISSGLLRKVQLASCFLDPEAQCLCRVPGGLWIGTRTGLFFTNAY